MFASGFALATRIPMGRETPDASSMTTSDVAPTAAAESAGGQGAHKLQARTAQPRLSAILCNAWRELGIRTEHPLHPTYNIEDTGRGEPDTTTNLAKCALQCYEWGWRGRKIVLHKSGAGLWPPTASSGG